MIEVFITNEQLQKTLTWVENTTIEDGYVRFAIDDWLNARGIDFLRWSLDCTGLVGEAYARVGSVRKGWIYAFRTKQDAILFKLTWV